MARFRPGAAFVPPGPPLASIAPPAPLAAMADLASVTLSVKVVDFSSAAVSAIERAIRGAIQASTRGLPGLAPPGGRGAAGGGGRGGGLIGGLLGEAGLGALAGPVGAMVAAAAAATAAVRGVVALASPGTAERFDLALKDATAVVGQALTPVLEQATSIVRLFGDILATILPSAAEFREALAPISDFLNDLRDALGSIAPVIHEVLVEGLKILGAALRTVILPFRILAKIIEGLFGGAEALKTSMGAAVRNVSFQSAESFAKQVNLAAFKSGIGTGKGPLDKIGDTVAQINKTLDDIRDWVKAIGQKYTGLKEAVSTAALKAAAGAVLPGTGGAAVDAALNIGRAIEIAGGKGKRTNPFELDLTGAIGKTRGKLAEIEEGRSRAANPAAFFERLLEILRSELREKGTPEKDIESEIQRHLDQAKRRGIDGHPGGA
jgi:hypothetical protein